MNQPIVSMCGPVYSSPPKMDEDDGGDNNDENLEGLTTSTDTLDIIGEHGTYTTAQALQREYQWSSIFILLIFGDMLPFQGKCL